MPETRITHKHENEPIRYLGVHYTLNGDWNYQLKLLETTLKMSLGKIRQRDLPPEQLIYLIHAVILPKLTYPLNVTNIISSKQAQQKIKRLDQIIADFTKLYLGYPTTISHKILYSPKPTGLELNSIEDQININTITNTTISLNTWQETKYWSKKLKQESKEAQTHQNNPITEHYNTRQATSDLYTKILQQQLSTEQKIRNSKVFLLNGHLKEKLVPDNIPNICTHIFSKMGYTLDLTTKSNNIITNIKIGSSDHYLTKPTKK